MQLNRKAAERALNERIGTRLGLSLEEAAAAVQEVVNENMALAARMHAAERGEDFRWFTLIAFGGAGPVHAWRLATLLKIRKVIVPAAAGVVSAAGLLVTPPAIELSRSYGGRFSILDFSVIDEILKDLERRCRSVLEQAGVSSSEIQVYRVGEWRYAGQMYEVQVPLPDGLLAEAGIESLSAAFERRYREIYGRIFPSGIVEAVTWRIRAEGPAPVNRFRFSRQEMAGNPYRGERKAYFHGIGFVRCKVVNRYGLQRGDRIAGPLLVEENETTTVIGPGSTVEVDEDLNLVINLD
jgi:N-methylhydantoinase A